AGRLARVVGPGEQGRRAAARSAGPRQGRVGGRAMSLRDKRVVVIGGTNGMGLATARLAAELGAAVVAAGRRPLEEREPLAGVTQARGDTTDEASVQALFAEVGELGPLLVASSPGSPGPLVGRGLGR